MLTVLTTLVAISTFYSATKAQCGVDAVQCCLTEFLGFVSPSGIKLDVEKALSACTIRNETLECLDNFEEQCVKENKELAETVKKTRSFISDICIPSSKFISDAITYGGCFKSASGSFLQCLNSSEPKNFGSDTDSKLKNDCCIYKELRNCAVQKVEDSCGETASQVIHEDVININGAGFELVCKDLFHECGAATGVLASSAAVLISLFITVLFSVNS
ncbi:uncharacterized protein LOC118186557 [Stegodyphus dumicola]|uniref:uncharacterized protein LOC118186557 n=1 Tax=Stegodyphus dumicola TaxID=202533 RepID=UPI0015AAC21D|nr:uncharacterized protein LOC118186557 [Stegodyphus dumicola]